MRNDLCPLCGSKTKSVLDLEFKEKLNLPTKPQIRACALDNFLFVGNGCQSDYDEYYQSIANDSYHSELSGGGLHSPIAMIQRDQLVQILRGFFQNPKTVLDFACGEGRLLSELAADHPASKFLGYDPSPATQWVQRVAREIGLKNLSIISLKEYSERGPYDLIIMSHVLEHLIDFQLLQQMSALLRDNGLLYIEIPDALRYEHYLRNEFLYYFDRLHVNHFTAESLTRLSSNFNLRYECHIEYEFPYRDGRMYPALGVLLSRNPEPSFPHSASLDESVRRYITSEKARAQITAEQFNRHPGVLVWGAGDNFFRSMGNNGPLAGTANIILIDSCPQHVEVGAKKYITVLPEEGMRSVDWPVVVTVSEGRRSIGEKILAIDPERASFFI